MGYRVLVVDNAAYAREQLKKLFGDHGHEVVGEAETVNQALAMYAKVKPDVVTVDLMLNGDSGFTVMLALRRLDANARLIAVSALRDDKTIDRAKEVGASAYVIKPERWPDLEAALIQTFPPP